MVAGARIRLEAEGIPTFVEGERMGAPAMYRVATGGVKLQVPAEFAADARVILSQDWSWPGELDGDDGPLDDLEEGHPRDSGSSRAFLIEVIALEPREPRSPRSVGADVAPDWRGPHRG